MSITPAEFALIVRGKASAELKERFLREADEPTGDLRRMLRSAQTWASTTLNETCPSPSISTPPAAAAIAPTRVLMRAAFSDAPAEKPDRPASRSDLTEVILGTASEETCVRVRNALEDPTSDVSLAVRSMSE